jgi:hypothetical protein
MARALPQLIFILSLFLCSCSKSSDDNGVNNPGTGNELIVINGVKDVSFDVAGNAGLQLSVQSLASKQEQVTLSVINLPNGLSANISSGSGMPPFTSAVAFSKTASLAPGTYPIKLVGTTPSHTRTYDLSVTVPGYVFNINGIRDVALFHATLKDTLQLSVEYSSGTNEPVALSVSGLPTGVSANITTVSGTPDYNSTIYFSAANSVPPGTYPIKITGTASHTNKSYDLKLIVPAFNGYKFNSLDFHTQTMTVTTVAGNGRFDITPIEQPGSGGHSVEGLILGAWPTADGTYTYQTNTGLPAAGNIRLRCNAYTSVFTCIPGRTVTVKVAAGKMSVVTAPIPATSGSSTLSLQLDARQP